MLVTLAEVHDERWTRTEELLALVAEVTDAAGWRAIVPHVKQGARLPKPLQVPRPGAKPKKRGSTLTEVMSFLPKTD